MESLLEWKLNIEKELGRSLKKEESEFVTELYERHLIERQDTRTPKNYTLTCLYHTSFYQN
ncbi:hypothetical protein HNQ35_001224 [Cerasibacillus quisquiliarum]|uniref:Uncharacterized protein n=1 Tax=Cerasibacillus quisquiliarum TaxID=227865 RepID=A0A511V2S3_9BACI|nr:hypothetical protein [Cerasibacillus quisquiliarum]MBB5146023.1 hypothetical protein [Cerasibacillus quisquiliarum]GEN32198.1 hypothetical protein CQU01_24360 [Cerasibacillus quisquiliarum]